MNLESKLQALQQWIREQRSVAVAFSGGVDSTFLLAVAQQTLGDQALAVIGCSPTYPAREYKDAVEFAKRLGAKTFEVHTDELSRPEFTTNPPTRCYACKTTLFSAIWEVARARGIDCVIEGSNADDTGDFRPGMAAARSLGVKAPLLELGFSKAEIRELSRALELPSWNKPAFACLSSRIPYGESITRERLWRIERAEDALLDAGFGQYRVRDHGDVARIEVLSSEISRFMDPTMREKIVESLRAAGYRYVCLDLEGYRTGAMNEALSESEKATARGRK